MRSEPEPEPPPPHVAPPRVPRKPALSFGMVWLALVLGLTAWGVLLALAWLAWW